MKTSEKIRNLRLSKGLSQEALGNLVGVKKAAINKYETGRVVNIKRSTLQRLAEALGVNPADLLDDVDFSVPSSDLTASEQALLSDFRQLNDEGQEIVLHTAQGLVASGQYIKIDEDPVGNQETA